MWVAGGGYFSRAAIVEGKGVALDPSGEISLEQIRDNWGKIKDMSGAEEFANANAEGLTRIFSNLQKGAASQ